MFVNVGEVAQSELQSSITSWRTCPRQTVSYGEYVTYRIIELFQKVKKTFKSKRP